MYFWDKLNNYRFFLKDFSYSFFSYALPTLVLYSIIQPVIARLIPGEENGAFLAQLSIVRFCCNILITPLSSLRLLEKQKIIDDNKIEAKFNFLYLFATLFGFIVTAVVVCFYMPAFSILDLLLTLLFLIFLFFHDYYSIWFRVVINFKKLSIDNCLIVLGYFIGLGVYYFMHKWQLVFIFGYFIGCLYVMCSSKEMWCVGFKNHRYPFINFKYVELGLSSGLGKATVYCDKLLIYPVLGGNSVSIYNAAAVVSKIISIIGIPIRTVLFTYIVDIKKITISKKNIHRGLFLSFIFIILVISLFSSIGYLLCKFLYPMFAKEATEYIIFIVSSVVIETLGATLNLIVLKCKKMSYQIFLASIKLVSYLCFVVFLTLIVEMGLWGFCFATLLTSILYLIIVLYYVRSCVVIN